MIAMPNPFKLLSLLVHLPTLLYGQAPGVDWSFNYGGSMPDAAHCISPTSDGGYILAGYTDSNDGDVTGHHGLRDIWVVKLNSDGTLEWQRCYGGSEVEGNVAVVREMEDGGYIIGGTTFSIDGDVDCPASLVSKIWIAGLNPVGQIIWQRCIGGNGVDVLSAVEVRPDHLLVCGHTTSNDGDAVGNHGSVDVVLIKLDLAGNTLWSRCYGGSRSDVGRYMTTSSDGGVIIAGDTQSNDGDLTDLNPYFTLPITSTVGWVLKVDDEGDILWRTCVGGFSNDFLYSAIEAPDGSIWAAGYTNSNDGDVSGNHGGGDAWVIRLNMSGELIGNRCLGGGGLDRFDGIHVLPSGNAVVVGRTTSVDGDITTPLGVMDAWVVCIRPELDVSWQQTMGGSAGDQGVGLAPAWNGGVVIAGYSQSNNGDLTGNNGDSDLWVLKLAPWDDTGLQPAHSVAPLQLFPNPVVDQLRVRHDAFPLAGLPWTVTDVTGRFILQGHFGMDEAALSVEGLASGVYHLLVGGGAQLATARFIKE